MLKPIIFKKGQEIICKYSDNSGFIADFNKIDELFIHLSDIQFFNKNGTYLHQICKLEIPKYSNTRDLLKINQS